MTTQSPDRSEQSIEERYAELQAETQRLCLQVSEAAEMTIQGIPTMVIEGFLPPNSAWEDAARALAQAVVDEILGTGCRCGVSRVMTLTCRRCRHVARIAALGSDSVPMDRDDQSKEA